MITLYIGALIGFAIGIGISIWDMASPSQVADGIMKYVFYLIWIIGFLAIGVLFALGPMLYLPSDEEYYIHSQNYEIVALQDSKEIYGKIYFLGSGSIGEKSVYRFYIKTDKGITMKTIDAKGVYIHYTTGAPYLEEETLKTRKIPGALDWGANIKRSNRKVETKIYIPEGSVKEEINLDLK